MRDLFWLRPGAEPRVVGLPHLDQRRFRSQFQPIYALDDGRLIAVEALTRFDTGSQRHPPDVWFAHAARVGLGIDLELAAVTAALEASARLPTGIALTFNASPALLADVFESLIAAIYLDGGYAPARIFVERELVPEIEAAVKARGEDNYKSQLQQFAQRLHPSRLRTLGLEGALSVGPVGRFAFHARILTVVAGASGFYMLHVMGGWSRYLSPASWWLVGRRCAPSIRQPLGLRWRRYQSWCRARIHTTPPTVPTA